MRARPSLSSVRGRAPEHHRQADQNGPEATNERVHFYLLSSYCISYMILRMDRAARSVKPPVGKARNRTSKAVSRTT